MHYQNVTLWEFAGIFGGSWFFKSLAYIRYSKGANTLPWGTPTRMSSSDDLQLNTLTYCFLLRKYDLKRSKAIPRIPQRSSF